MRKTFVCDESMVITIPLGNFKNDGAGQLMPEKFNCVFRDSFKVFVVRGKPKPLGVSLVIYRTDINVLHHVNTLLYGLCFIFIVFSVCLSIYLFLFIYKAAQAIAGVFLCTLGLVSAVKLMIPTVSSVLVNTFLKTPV